MTPATQARTSAPNRRPSGAQPGEGEHGDEPDQVDGGDGVRRPVDGRQDQGEPGGGDELRHHEPSRAERLERQDDARDQEPEPDQADQLLEGERRRTSRRCRRRRRRAPASPNATVVSASAATVRPRRPSTVPAAPVAPVRTTRTAVRPPTPSQVQATARKITAATSRQVAPSPSRILGTEAPWRPCRTGAGAGDGHRREVRVEAGCGRAAACGRRGRGDGRGAQPVEQVVGLAQRAEQLGGEEALQRQGARRAAERRVRAACCGSRDRRRCPRSAVGWRSYSHCAAPSAPDRECRPTQPVVSIRAHEPLLSTRHECQEQRGPSPSASSPSTSRPPARCRRSTRSSPSAPAWSRTPSRRSTSS